MMDISLEGRDPVLSEITRLARMKTAALFTFACEAGAIMGKASASARQAITAYGQELGLAYQIADDLGWSVAESGKPARKDGARSKPKLASYLGPDRARAQAEAMVAQAAAHLDLFDEKADLLREAARFVVARTA
jgi:farnesyl diphosphate synthase